MAPDVRHESLLFCTMVAVLSLAAAALRAPPAYTRRLKRSLRRTFDVESASCTDRYRGRHALEPTPPKQIRDSQVIMIVQRAE